MSKISFDAYLHNGRLHLDRTPFDGAGGVMGKMRISTSSADTIPSSPPATTQYPLHVDSGYDYAPWGEWDGDDNLPNRIEAKFSKVSIAAQAALKLAKLLYGNGLVYFKEADLARSAQPLRHYHPLVEDFLQENLVATEWLFPQCQDWQRHWNTFSEMKLSMSGRFITNIFHKEAPFCRLGSQGADGIVRHLLYDAYFAWGQHQRSSSGDGSPGGSAVLLPLLNWFDKEAFFENLKGHTFAWHSRIRYGRAVYYSRPPWLGLFARNGWLDAAADVPRIVNAMQRNQINLKYQILVEETYFKIEHPEWESYTAAQRSAALDRFENAINDKFVGLDNGFASILSVYRYDALQAKELGKIEIVAIDDKLKKDAWVPGAERANFEIVQGLGAHPTQFGLAKENGAMGGGSGSDKREEFNTAITTNTVEQVYLLAPLNFISRFNGWGVRFCIDHTSHTTSNLSETGLVPSRNTLQPASKGEGEQD